MKTDTVLNREQHTPSINNYRSQLLSGLPVHERRIDIAGISSAVLEGGEGPPVVLLHGPGETSLWWMRVIPKLVTTNRVIVPDLPGHGSSKVEKDILDHDRVMKWLGELISHTCDSQPTLVGHILGGAIAARFAVEYGERINRLVLVDSLGLGKFRPSPGFAFRLVRFLISPTKNNYNRFLPHCMYDVQNLEEEMGTDWEPFLAYNLECAQDPDRKDALKTLMQKVGVPKIPDEDLERINVPVSLIWGRHDKANKLKIAEQLSDRLDWPLHIIEETRDDPKLEQPESFLDALYETMNHG